MLIATSNSRVLRRPLETAQYASADYRKLMQSAGLRASMSRKGDCYDNAQMQSFFHTLKTALVHHRQYQTCAEAQRDIFAFIEGFYNRTCRHSASRFYQKIISPTPYGREFDQIRSAAPRPSLAPAPPIASRVARGSFTPRRSQIRT
ncbi:transposase [Bradyrhizobium hipponense]|uniref:Transposase n=1 Tax=Bradyrhizobium hipponense TaxID=2605638 RepID=A0A5S4YBI5_9BRAD|nr:transposase [Bradyrhizobium hipponense]